MRLAVSRFRGGRTVGFVIPAMQDMIQLRDGIATFDTYWHIALKSSHGCTCVLLSLCLYTGNPEVFFSKIAVVKVYGLLIFYEIWADFQPLQNIT